MQFNTREKNIKLEIINDKEILENKIKKLYNECFFSEYLDEKKLEELYWYKFCLYTFDLRIYNEDGINFVIKKDELLKKALLHKVELMLSKKDTNLNKIFNKDINKAIYYIVRILKNGKRKIDYNDIVNDKFLFNFIVLLDKDNGIKYFFENYMVDRDEYIDYKKINNTIELDKNIPLVTAGLFSERKNKDIFKLYDLTSHKKIDSTYYVPEGIYGINYIDIKHNNIYDKLVKSNSVVFPKSLNHINGNISLVLNKKDITVYPNLKEIDDNVLKNINSITIKIDCNISDFNDYVNSNDISAFNSLFYCKYNNKTKMHPKLYDYINSYINKDKYVFYHEGMNYFNKLSYGYDVFTKTNIKLLFNDKEIELNGNIYSNFTDYITRTYNTRNMAFVNNNIEMVKEKVLELSKCK